MSSCGPACAVDFAAKCFWDPEVHHLLYSRLGPPGFLFRHVLRVFLLRLSDFFWEPEVHHLRSHFA